MAEKLPEEGWIKRIVNIVEKSPLICIIIYLCWRDVRKDDIQAEKDKQREQREYEDTKFIKDAYIYYRNDKERDVERKERELKNSFPDTIQ